MNHQQLASLKQTEFINLIIDETRDISIKQMICICLRYVEKESGVIKEEVFKLGPIHDETGEGKRISRDNERLSCFLISIRNFLRG